MPSVLFLCTANRFRSPLAAAIFRNKLNEDGQLASWQVGSAGTWTVPGLPAIPLALLAAQQLGLDLNAHASVPVNAQMLAEHDLILVMETGHKEALASEFPFVRKRVYLLSEVVDKVAYDIPDPEQSNEEAGEIARELNDLIQRGYAQICLLAEALHTQKN